MSHLRLSATEDSNMIEDASQHLLGLLSMNVIHESSSPWASNLATMRENDGSLGLCVDYKKLNIILKVDYSNIPGIESLLDMV